MDSSWKNSRHVFLVFPELSPLLNYGPLTNKGMKFCKCRISKSIIARNLKLVSADRGFDENLKKIHMTFFELLPFFKILDPEILQV